MTNPSMAHPWLRLTRLDKPHRYLPAVMADPLGTVVCQCWPAAPGTRADLCSGGSGYARRRLRDQ